MRARKGAARNRAKKRLFRKVEGFVGGRRRLLRTAKETLLRAGMFAFRDRRAKKRDFRRLFITRLSAAAEMRGLRYSRLVHGLKLSNIGLDRKSLSELAIHDPETFDAIVATLGAIAFYVQRQEVPETHDAVRAAATGTPSGSPGTPFVRPTSPALATTSDAGRPQMKGSSSAWRPASTIAARSTVSSSRPMALKRFSRTRRA